MILILTLVGVGTAHFLGFEAILLNFTYEKNKKDFLQKIEYYLIESKIVNERKLMEMKM